VSVQNESLSGFLALKKAESAAGMQSVPNQGVKVTTSISRGGVTIRLFSPAVAPASDLVEKRKERADTFLFKLRSNPLFVPSPGMNRVPARFLLSETQRKKL
jgi:hypothetical protein